MSESGKVAISSLTARRAIQILKASQRPFHLVLVGRVQGPSPGRSDQAFPTLLLTSHCIFTGSFLSMAPWCDVGSSRSQGNTLSIWPMATTVALGPRMNANHYCLANPWLDALISHLPRAQTCELLCCLQTSTACKTLS